MKLTHIESLLSEVKLLESEIEKIKENNNIPFSFFKESFERIQEISCLLHKLEFMQIGNMRDEMKRLVQYLSEAESSKKEIEEKAELRLATAATTIEELKSQNETLELRNRETEEALEKQKYKEIDNKVEDNLIDDETLEENIQPTILSQSEKKISNPISTNNKSLNDVQSVDKTVQEVMRSISLNDRFLFQRELFNNDREAMNTMLTKLQSFSSFDIAKSYLETNTNWNFSDETVDSFLQMLRERF